MFVNPEIFFRYFAKLVLTKIVEHCSNHVNGTLVDIIILSIKYKVRRDGGNVTLQKRMR